MRERQKQQEKEAQELKERRQIIQRKGLQVGVCVTVENFSANPGDAVVKGLTDTGFVSIKYDDGKEYSEANPSDLEVFDTAKHMAQLEHTLGAQRLQLRDAVKCVRHAFLEVNASQGNTFFWRGLRVDEGVSGLHARDPSSPLTLQEAIDEGALPSSYVSLTTKCEAAFFYAASRTNHFLCRIAQVDWSQLHEDDVVDLTSESKCRSAGVCHPRAINYAIAHQLVVVRRYIPPRAIIAIHDINRLGVPRGLQKCSLQEYRDLLLAMPRVTAAMHKWKADGLQHLLEQEVKDSGARRPARVRYPGHVVAIARARGAAAGGKGGRDVLWMRVIQHKWIDPFDWPIFMRPSHSWGGASHSCPSTRRWQWR